MTTGTTRPAVLSATTMIGDRVCNAAGEDLGKLEEIMIDYETGRVAYAVLSFGGFLGLGDKLFAIPWSMLQLSTEEHEFNLDVAKERLEEAPGFDKNDWPDFADRDWGEMVYGFYQITPYWRA
jgi:sporulation protein YlmC with PRC-barrel domain